MRSILLHVHDDTGLESRLQAALDLARGFDGHVTLLQSISYAMPMPGDFYGGIGVEFTPIIQEQATALRKQLETRLAGEDARWSWIDEGGWAESRMLEYAALSDVLVVSAADPDGSKRGPSRLAGEVAINARTPVLVVPGSARGFDVGGAAIVGWDGSPEASRALRSALPLLAKASSVTLATVSGKGAADGYDLPPTSGAEYLSRHGVRCDMVELPRDGKHPSEVLAAAAQSGGSGLMVMGAYGQARLIESMLGGVTHRMLANPPVPLLMAH